MRPAISRGATAAFFALATADTLLAGRGGHAVRWITKPLLTPSLIPGRDRATQRALALGALGDLALLGEGPAAFSAGLASFLAGHGAWIAALRARRRDGDVHARRAGLLHRRPALAAPYLVTCVGLNIYLWPRAGRYRWPVIAYSCALTSMALVALDSGDPAAIGGGAAFLASDSLLALERFADVHLPGHDAWVMGTYSAAQALLAHGGARR